MIGTNLDGYRRDPPSAPIDRIRDRCWFAVLAVETAMRQGEMLSLTWSDVDLDKCIAHLDMTEHG